MRFYDSLESVPKDFGPSAVTLGKFDGVHLGHQAVIRALTNAAVSRSLTSVAVTFDRNPLTLLDPARRPPDLVSPAQKRELLQDAGLDVTLELGFSEKFSQQSPEEFIEHVLVDCLHAKLVLVGPDARFGVGGSGSFDTLVEFGRVFDFEVSRLAPELANHDLPASSTLVRRMLGEGDVRAATAVLGRYPVVRSVVVHGQKRGRALGYPTANLDPDLEGFVPADGVYAGYLRIVEPASASASASGGDGDGGGGQALGEAERLPPGVLPAERMPAEGMPAERMPAEGMPAERMPSERMPAAISVGNNPTFEGVPEKQVEAFVLDRTLDLYDRTVEVAFVDRVRGMYKFDSLNELIDQMADDTARVRSILAASPTDI